MQKSNLVRPLPLAFIIIAVLGLSIAPAAAGSWAARTHPRYHSYYALAPSESEPSAITQHAGDCFRSNNAVEATRGIRHWTGACAGGH
jgi:hypothetical protein